MRGEEWISKFVDRLHIVQSDGGLRKYAEAIYPRGDPVQVIKRIWIRRVAAVLVLIPVAAVIWLVCFMTEPGPSVLEDGRYLTRQKEDSVVEMEVRGESRDGKWDKTVRLNLRERTFTDEEKGELDRKLQEYVEAQLPGENPSLDQVTMPLVFVEEIPGTEISLDWSWDEEYIKENGRPNTIGLPAEGTDTDVMLKASWKNWKKTLYYTIHLMPPELSREEEQIHTVETVLKETLKGNSDQEMVELPRSVGGVELAYHMKESGKDYSLLYLVLGGAILLPVLGVQKRKKQMAEREEQMVLDYPGIVNKVMLLLGAGLTFRGAVERITSEYERGRREQEGIRYAYEELCIMIQEMRDGVSESMAMEHFGRKCRLMPYLRFSSVVTQNLKKGADGILDLLEQESLEAMEQRKERVLRMGETAGTKLLFPMIVLLGLVMSIIMVPAFMTL